MPAVSMVTASMSVLASPGSKFTRTAIDRSGNRLDMYVPNLMPRDIGEPFSTRERRYPIRIDVRYRHSGDRHWHIGFTENISRGGILIRTRGATMPPLTAIDVFLALPPEVGGADGMPVIGRGFVVRLELPRQGSEDAAVAATIVQYVAAYVPDTDPRRI
jgi:hypothetical protein